MRQICLSNVPVTDSIKDFAMGGFIYKFVVPMALVVSGCFFSSEDKSPPTKILISEDQRIEFEAPVTASIYTVESTPIGRYNLWLEDPELNANSLITIEEDTSAAPLVRFKEYEAELTGFEGMPLESVRHEVGRFGNWDSVALFHGTRLTPDSVLWHAKFYLCTYQQTAFRISVQAPKDSYARINKQSEQVVRTMKVLK